MTRAVARYIKLHGEPVAGRFVRMVCPVNVRRDNQGESLGNQISFLPVALPLDIRDPVQMLHAVATRTEIMKNARAAHLVTLMASWLGAAPPPLQALFWGAIPQLPLPVSLLNMICTNVPGSPTPLYAVGRKMIACYPHVPTGYELGVNCAVQSYDGQSVLRPYRRCAGGSGRREAARFHSGLIPGAAPRRGGAKGAQAEKVASGGGRGGLTAESADHSRVAHLDRFHGLALHEEPDPGCPFFHAPGW